MDLKDYYLDPEYILRRKPITLDKHRELESGMMAYRNNKLEVSPWAEAMIAPLGMNYMDAEKAGGYITRGQLHYQAATIWYKEKKAKTYVIEKNFFRALMDSKLEVPPHDLLQGDFNGYVAFPKNTLQYRDIYVLGAYINLVRGQDIPSCFGLNPFKNYISIVALTDLSHVVPGAFGQVAIYLNIDDEHSIEEILNSMLYTGTSPSEERKESASVMLRSCLLALMYLKTGAPDLREMRPQGELSKSGRAHAAASGKLESDYSGDIAIPVELVSWGWAKEPLYTKEAWTVSACFRHYWEGPGRSVKTLKWIAPTTAHRKSLQDPKSI